jgi:hypothetical protein
LRRPDDQRARIADLGGVVLSGSPSSGILSQTKSRKASDSGGQYQAGMSPRIPFP